MIRVSTSAENSVITVSIAMPLPALYPAQVGRASSPHAPIDRKCTHASGYGIRLDDALDGGHAVCGYARAKVPAGQSAISQAVAQSPQRTLVLQINRHYLSRE
jgi:hypothetical protein